MRYHGFSPFSFPFLRHYLFLAILLLDYPVTSVQGQIFSPGAAPNLHSISLQQPLLPYQVVSPEQKNAWPIEYKQSGPRMWSEIAWPGQGLEFNYYIWPQRVVFTVSQKGNVARATAFWRRSALSIRIDGMKLLSAASGKEISNARVLDYNQEKIDLEFEPVDGPGTYLLYFEAIKSTAFNPSTEWLEQAQTGPAVTAQAERIEVRNLLDDPFPMEIIALPQELQQLMDSAPDADYLVFPQDRNPSIRLQFEIPACWITRNPAEPFILDADRNEYRVFQLGIWACRTDLADIRLEFNDLQSTAGTVIPAAALQCLTLESRCKSQYIKKPVSPYPVPKGQVRALWCGIDLSETIAAGEYQGSIILAPQSQKPCRIPLKLRVSDEIVEARGDHDLKRLSRLRWMESDIGLDDEVFDPYKPLVPSEGKRQMQTWGHTIHLNKQGLPAKIQFSQEDILANDLEIHCSMNGHIFEWKEQDVSFTEAAAGHITWLGSASAGALQLQVEGRLDFDGCIICSLKLTADQETTIDDLTVTLPWNKKHAGLAAGMGYRGLRSGDRLWTFRDNYPIDQIPALWLGSPQAGLGFITWDKIPWETPSRLDAGRVTETSDDIRLNLNFGRHGISANKPWSMQFALRPTPVKPTDLRHWQFRYLHRWSDFRPAPDNTPHSYLADHARQLDEAVKLGVKRLNLHDWWGPCFNYAWQWDRPDNLAAMTRAAHERGLFVKVYNSGRELSANTPEFWGLVYEGTQYQFRDQVAPRPDGKFPDAWHELHLPDGLPQGWVRHIDEGIEHCIPVSNATRIGNFYLENMRYMTENFGTDGAYWDGADGPTLGHREMAKRLWTLFRKINPNAVIDVHHGTSHMSAPIADCMLVLPFIDSIWHGEGYDYKHYDPWAWLVEIAAVPFGIPSELLGGEEFLERGMLFGIWPRMGWCAGVEKQRKLWQFCDQFHMEEAQMLGWWSGSNGITIDKPQTYATAFVHPQNGVLIALASWHPVPPEWVGITFDVALDLDREILHLPAGPLCATDILSGQDADLAKPVVLPPTSFGSNRTLDFYPGRLLWIRPQ